MNREMVVALQWVEWVRRRSLRQLGPHFGLSLRLAISIAAYQSARDER